jgi:alpha-L-fucosidase 2
MRVLALAFLLVLPLGSEPLLWYDRPAEQWVEALPVGNGRLGGMVFGRIEDERIQLNEDTLWAGAAQERDIPGAFRHLAEIRKMLFDGRYVEAERKIAESIMGERIFPKGYQTLGDLWLDSAPPQGPTHYRRELDLESGVARSEWTDGTVKFSREVSRARRTTSWSFASRRTGPGQSPRLCVSTALLTQRRQLLATNCCSRAAQATKGNSSACASKRGSAPTPMAVPSVPTAALS